MNEDKLLSEQFIALAHLMPIMYTAVTVYNTFNFIFYCINFSHPYGYIVLLISIAFTFYRAVAWWKIAKNSGGYSPEAMKAIIDRTLVGLVAIDGLNVVAAYAIMREFPESSRILITCLSLSPSIVASYLFAIVPRLALASVAISFFPTIAFGAFSDSPSLQWIAGATMIMGVAQTWTILRQFKNFKEIVESRERLKDAHKRLEVAERLAHAQAHTDPLTGLPNRRGLDALLAEYKVSRARRVAIAVIDLDGFKEVNDRHGHAVGDTLLRLVAARLLGQLRHFGEIIRLGGDEFALVCQDETLFAELQGAANRVIDALKQPYRIDGTLVRIGASTGLCIGERNDSLERVMAAADRALYDVKRNGKGFSKVVREQPIAIEGALVLESFYEH